MSTYYDPTINLDAQAQQNENKLVNLGLSKMPVPHISGLKLQEDVTLGSLTLNKIDPATGVVWVLTDLKGWWTLPDSEFPDVARGWGDGSYDASGRYAARILTLEGSFLTQNPDQVAEARAKLTSAINLVYRGADLIVRERVTLTASDMNESTETITIPSHGLVVGDVLTYKSDGVPISGLVSGRTYYVKTAPTVNTITLSATLGGSTLNISNFQNSPAVVKFPPATKHTFDVVKPKVTNVRISGKPQIDTVNARGRTDFSIGLKAANPLKYEYYPDAENGNYRTVTLTRGSDVVVRNMGDAKVPVIFALSGNTVADGTITNTANGTSQQINGIYMDISDATLEIDTYNRNIIAIDSVGNTRIGRRYANSYIDWIQLEPGDNTLRFESTDTSATCVMYYKSGWLG